MRGKVGIQNLVVVRQGDTIHALHDQCAHAGGPLSGGRIVDGCIECPWHGSRFELATGRRRRGPTVYDQPAYEVRAAEAGGYEGGRPDPDAALRQRPAAADPADSVRRRRPQGRRALGRRRNSGIGRSQRGRWARCARQSASAVIAS